MNELTTPNLLFKIRDKRTELFVDKKHLGDTLPFRLSKNGRVFTRLSFLKMAVESWGLIGKFDSPMKIAEMVKADLGTLDDYEVVQYLLVEGNTQDLKEILS